MVKKQKKKIIITAIVMVLVALTLVFSPMISGYARKVLLNNFNIVSSHDNMIVHFISVGQGDSAAINLPDGKVLLIDAGPTDSAATLTNYLTQNVLGRKTSDTIDYLILTHADLDHYGGALRILKNFDVGTVFMPLIDGTGPTYENFKNYVQKNSNYVTIEKDYLIKENGYSIKFLGPVVNDDENNSCPVVKVSYNERSFLFAGDIDQPTEKLFMNVYAEELDCDVLKVAHHGSKYSSSSEFLESVTPKFSVVSVGENIYGHPTEEVLSRLELSGSETIRTDENGNIIFVVGECYDLNVLTGTFVITNLDIQYYYLVIVVEVAIVFYFVKLIIKTRRYDKLKK